MGRRGDRVALRDEGSGGIPGATLRGHESAVPEHGVADCVVAFRSGSDDRLGKGRVCAIPIAHREARDGQLPEREVPPGADVPLELNRPGCIRERILGALAGHGGSEHRPPGLEGGCAVWRPALERSTLGDVRIAHRRPDIARGHLLPGREHCEPWACHEGGGTETHRPRPDRRSTAGPVIQAKAVADERGGELEITRCERVIDGGLDGVVRLVPGGRSPVEGGHDDGARETASSRRRNSRKSVW